MAVWRAIEEELQHLTLTTLALWNRFKTFLGLLAVKYGIQGHFEYKGLHFTKMAFSKERLDACEHYDNFRPDDVILMTYPKTGTHFVAEVLISIGKEKGLLKPDVTMRTAGAPLEFDRLTLFNDDKKEHNIMVNIDKCPSPRCIGTHLPWNLLPLKVREGNIKVIHCYRNPKDVACSSYPFMLILGVYTKGTRWSDFIKYFIDGTVLYGGYLQWLKQWYPHRNNTNILNLQFEDMKKNLRGNVKKIAEFLNIELTPEQVDNVVAANSFEKRKKEAGFKSFIYRKGESGGWKSDITVEQNEMLDKWIQTETADMPEWKFQYC